MDGGDNNSGLPCDVIDGTDVRVDDSLSAHCTVHSNPLPDPLRSKAAQHCAVHYCTVHYYTVRYWSPYLCICKNTPYVSSSISNVVLNNYSYLK